MEAPILAAQRGAKARTAGQPLLGTGTLKPTPIGDHDHMNSLDRKVGIAEEQDFAPNSSTRTNITGYSMVRVDNSFWRNEQTTNLPTLTLNA